MTTIIYSSDIQKPIATWTTEVYESHKEAMINACELLESGFYVQIESD